MKYILAVCDGMADFSRCSVLAAAKKPLLDDLAGRGHLGIIAGKAAKMPDGLSGAESIPALLAAVKRDETGVVHVSLPEGSAKQDAIEALDRDILDPVVCALEDEGEDFRLLVIAGGTEDRGIYLLYDSRFDMHTKLTFTPEDAEDGIVLSEETNLTEVLYGK